MVNESTTHIGWAAWYKWCVSKKYAKFIVEKWRKNKTKILRSYIYSTPHLQIDMAFASIWLTLDQYKFVSLSESWYQIYIHFLVPRPHRTTSFWALSRPFSEEIWYLLLSALLLHCLYTYVRAWIDPKFPRRKKLLKVLFAIYHRRCTTQEISPKH